MARLTVYDPNLDRTYSISMELARSYRMSALGATEDEDIYVIITTDIPETGGDRRDPYVIRTLEDVPADGGPASAADFNALFDRWVLWIKDDGGLGIDPPESSSESSSGV